MPKIKVNKKSFTKKVQKGGLLTDEEIIDDYEKIIKSIIEIKDIYINKDERLVEVSPEKKVVWSWKADVPAVHHFQVLSIDGGDLDGPPLR